jgi:hypothetical protein
MTRSAIAAGSLAVREPTAILQPNPRGPALPACALDEMPNRGVEPMQQDLSSQLRALKDPRDPIRDLVGLRERLFLDLDEDTQDPMAIRDRD